MSEPTGDDDDDTTNGVTDGLGRASDAEHGGPPGADPGAEIVGDILAVFLVDLASIEGGALEALRVNTERAGELLRADGVDVSLPFRLELRRARRLVGRLYEIVEADLPPG